MWIAWCCTTVNPGCRPKITVNSIHRRQKKGEMHNYSYNSTNVVYFTSTVINEYSIRWTYGMYIRAPQSRMQQLIYVGVMLLYIKLWVSCSRDCSNSMYAYRVLGQHTICPTIGHVGNNRSLAVSYFWQVFEAKVSCTNGWKLYTWYNKLSQGLNVWSSENCPTCSINNCS